MSTHFANSLNYIVGSDTMAHVTSRVNPACAVSCVEECSIVVVATGDVPEGGAMRHWLETCSAPIPTGEWECVDVLLGSDPRSIESTTVGQPLVSSYRLTPKLHRTPTALEDLPEIVSPSRFVSICAASAGRLLIPVFSMDEIVDEASPCWDAESGWEDHQVSMVPSR